MIEAKGRAAQPTGSPPEGITISEVAPKEVRRRRLERRFLWYLYWGGVAFLAIGPLVFLLVGALRREDLLQMYAALALPAVVLVGGNLLYVRGTVLAVNRVAICERGIYPPIKPKDRRVKEDLFIAYKDIVSMEPVTERAGLVPAYNITLRDGLKFQMNCLNLLMYVREPEVRRFEKMLRVVKQELSRPESQARAARGEDVVIPREKFGAAAAA